jgi:predicted RNase H-like nuclease (RuvC/YqgF family)
MFGIDTTIFIAVLGVIGSIVNGIMIHLSNRKSNTAMSKKTNAEADQIIFRLKSETINDLQNQIDALKEEIRSLQKQEHVHLQEKIRLEELMSMLKQENTSLKDNLKLSNNEIDKLRKRIVKLTEELKIFKAK